MAGSRFVARHGTQVSDSALNSETVGKIRRSAVIWPAPRAEGMGWLWSVCIVSWGGLNLQVRRQEGNHGRGTGEFH